jgi:hypothetical protein
LTKDQAIVLDKYHDRRFAMRRSGKKALIKIQFETETPFDISGASSDGYSRSNEFSFEISAEVQEGVSGYNEKYGETIPIGQTAWSASIKSFYNHANGEVNAFLRTMFTRQHDPDNNWDYDFSYKLIIMPDGDRLGFEMWTLSNAVIKNYAPDLPHGDIMTLAAEFSGGKWSFTTITA